MTTIIGFPVEPAHQTGVSIFVVCACCRLALHYPIERMHDIEYRHAIPLCLWCHAARCIAYKQPSSRQHFHEAT